MFLEYVILDKHETLKLIRAMGLKLGEGSPLNQFTFKEPLDFSSLKVKHVSEDAAKLLGIIADPEQVLLLLIKAADFEYNLLYYGKEGVLLQYGIENEEPAIYDVLDGLSLVDFLHSLFKHSAGNRASYMVLSIPEYLVLCAAIKLQEYSDFIGGISQEDDFLHFTTTDLKEEIQISLNKTLKGPIKWTQKDEAQINATISNLVKKGFLQYMKGGLLKITEHWKKLVSVTSTDSMSLTMWIRNFKRKEDKSVRVMGNVDGTVSFEIYSNGVILREIPSSQLKNYLLLTIFGAAESVPASVQVCPRCGFTNDSTSRFCIKCGQSLTKTLKPAQSQDAKPQALYCIKCGAKILPGAKFCTKCGAKIT